jgi:hypothetical protein
MIAKKNDKPICCRLLGKPKPSDKEYVRVINDKGEYIYMWLSKSFLKKLEEYVHTDDSSEPIQLRLPRNKE